MARRFLLVTLTLCLTGLGLRAQERATFILTDGQRVSGTLDTRETGRDLGLVANVGQGAETFRFDQVAVIDFAGVAPRAGELAGLPTGGNMLVMRNGGTRVGYLISVNGTSVTWQEEGGGRLDIPVRQISRVYLNPDAARSAYNYAGRRSVGSGYGQGYGSSSNSDVQILASSVSVPATIPWSDTSVQVMRGDVLRFDDQGGITFIRGENNTANAGGKTEMKSDNYPVPSAGVGALIGKIGTTGTPFLIGAGANPVTMPATGRLFLGVNDDNFADNSGAFTVTIMRRR